MVFFITSANVKLIKDLLDDYKLQIEISPHEYMENYIKLKAEDIKEPKLIWITDTFLGIQKHLGFLRSVCSDSFIQQLPEVEQQYFIIIFHDLIFHGDLTTTSLLYKTLFNLSKNLLNVLTSYLGNIDILIYLSDIAQNYYDTEFITKELINPLISWQPHMKNLNGIYERYVEETEKMKKKMPTIAIQPNVLNYKTKSVTRDSHTDEFEEPLAPPNSISLEQKKMLTKDVIDKKIQILHIKNKQKADKLLNEVKLMDTHYAMQNSKKVDHISSETRKDIDGTPIIPKRITKFDVNKFKKQPIQPIKETTATLKRLKKQIKVAEDKELEWFQNIVKNCSNDVGIEELQQRYYQELEEERILNIEKNHLMGQISHEEALIARQKIVDENKKKYEEFLKEKIQWDRQIDKWKKIELEKKQKLVESMSLDELNLIQAKVNVASKKKEICNEVKRESEKLRTNIIKAKQEELEKKIMMIKEIKVLAMISQNAKLPKIIDLTETSGFGFLCEMSMAELQERLVAFKIKIKEDLEAKKNEIKEQRLVEKKELNDLKLSVQSYLSEKAKTRKIKENKVTDIVPNKEINDLKKILEEKRKLRKELACS